MVYAITAKDQDISHANAIREYAMRITKEDTIMNGKMLATNQMSNKLITTDNHKEMSIQETIERENHHDLTQGLTINIATVTHGEREVGKENQALIENPDIDTQVVTTGIVFRTRMRLIMTSVVT